MSHVKFEKLYKNPFLARFGPGAEISFFFAFGGSVSNADEAIPSDVEGETVFSSFIFGR